MKAVGWLVLALLLIIAFTFIINIALMRDVQAHDFWINNGGYKNAAGVHCCGTGDCKSFKEGEVIRVAGGYLILATNEFVPFADAQVGEDEFYWRCRKGDGSLRCFFTPTGGV